MLQKLNLNSKNERVMGFRVNGKINEKDVKNSIEEIKPALGSPSGFNIYLEVESFESISPEAMKERLKFTFNNYQEVVEKVEKIALVTDIDWMRNSAQVMYDLIPGIELKNYTFEEAEKAKQWVAE